MADIENKIRKRIKIIQEIKNSKIDEVQITKEEAEQLGDRKYIDGVKLKIVQQLGDMTKMDCFAYINHGGHKRCYGLNKLYCKNEECKFYNNKLSLGSIELACEKYAQGR